MSARLPERSRAAGDRSNFGYWRSRLKPVPGRVDIYAVRRLLLLLALACGLSLSGCGTPAGTNSTQSQRATTVANNRELAAIAKRTLQKGVVIYSQRRDGSENSWYTALEVVDGSDFAWYLLPATSRLATSDSVLRVPDAAADYVLVGCAFYQ